MADTAEEITFTTLPTVVAAPVTLFGTADPVAVVDRASSVATALADVIKKRRLYKHIGQSDHVFVEGWTLLGSMLGVFAEVEWSRPLEGGWEARAVARTLSGQTVGAAEAMCSHSEGKWRTSDEYALRSMAQTRAVSKALRLPLGFIMELAGYSATPAEELTELQPPEQQGRANPVPNMGKIAVPKQPNAYRRGELAQLAAARGLDNKALNRYADQVGVPPGEPASDAQIDAIIEILEAEAALPDIPA